MMTISNQNLQKEWEYWYPRVYGYFYRRLNDQFIVEELTAQTLNTCFLAKDIVNFKAYLWKVAHNYLVKYIDTKSKEFMVVGLDGTESLENESSFEVDTKIESSRSKNYKQTVKKLVGCLNKQFKTEQEKQLVNLSIVHDKNSTEIGKELNLKPGTVRQKLARAISRLKKGCTRIWHEFTNSTNPKNQEAYEG